MTKKVRPDAFCGLLDPSAGMGTRWGRALEGIALFSALGIALLVVLQILDVQLGDWGVLWTVQVVLLTAAVVLLLFGTARLRCSGRTLLLVGMLVSLLLRLTFLLAVNTPPNSDFYVLNQASWMLAQGDLSWTEQVYFQNWGYQIPFVAYQALVLKLIPSNWALKALNLAFMVGSNFLIYKLGRLFVSENAAASAAALYAVYPGAIHMVSVLTNQHIGLFFLLLGLWLLLSRLTWPRMLLAGICLAAANLMRPEEAVVWAAILCCGVCVLVRWPAKERAKRMALGLALALAVYVLAQAAAGLALRVSGIAPHGIGNNVPEWKFVVGLDAENEYGDYTMENAHVLTIENDAERERETWRVIRQSFRDCENVPGFFLSKVRAMWAWDESFHWSMGHLKRNAQPVPGVTVDMLMSGMLLVERGVDLGLWGLLAAAAVLVFRRPERREKGIALVSVAVICAFFCVYLLIEVQPRYRYSVIPFLVVLSGGVVQRFLALGGFSRSKKEKR